MGFFCESIVEEALTKAGFVTVSRNAKTRYFRGRTYPRKNDLDFIAYSGGVFYGIEVKNTISVPDSSDIGRKKDVAEFHDIQFLLIARSLGHLSYEIFQDGGMYIEFGKLIWSPKFSSFAERVEEKLLYPVICTNESPDLLISKSKKIPKLHDKHFKEKGRI